MPAAIATDGTTIAYEKTGQGPCIIMVNGALSHRHLYGEQDLADKLSKNFKVIFYDRRGRGESTDVKPFSSEKEIDDLQALIREVDEPVYLYGSSSGAALAFLAAEKSGPEKIIKLALYEPPYGAFKEKKEFSELKNKINDLVVSGKSEEAVTIFLEGQGMAADALEGMKKSPEWKEMVRVGHTLVYDFELLGDGDIPVNAAKNIRIPTLVMAGERSFEFMHTTAGSLAKLIPGAERKILKGQMHEVSPEALAPVLKEFFLITKEKEIS